MITECPEPPSVTNAEIDINMPDINQTVLFYKCHSGFNMIGSEFITCQNYSTWTQPMFVCTGKCFEIISYNLWTLAFMYKCYILEIKAGHIVRAIPQNHSNGKKIDISNIYMYDFSLSWLGKYFSS